MTRLPPFKALLAFRAAATRDRLRDAAESLGVTESAISHQIRNLETGLGVRLFDRVSGRLALTEAGAAYLARIEPALAEIERATEALSPAPETDVVRVTLPPALAAIWLVPRLARFEAETPGVETQLVLTTRVLDLDRDRIDAAIRYGKGPWTGVDARFLFPDRATPVAAPGYLPDGADPASPPPTLRYIVTRSIPGEWEEWARARGLPPPQPGAEIQVDTIEQALQIAEAGRGLAMGRSPYVEDRLAAGALVAPFGRAGPDGAAYFLCRAAGRAPSRAARRFARWLEVEAAAFIAADT